MSADPSRGATTSVQQDTEEIFNGLAYRLVQARSTNTRCLVLAFTSCYPGEGVSRVVGALHESLLRNSSIRTLVIDPSWFSAHQQEAAGQPKSVRSSEEQAVLPGWDHQRAALDRLRPRYGAVLIDCPALSKSASALSLSPVVDGVVLVVEANRTKRDDITHAEQRLESAGAKIVGLILNKE